MEKSIFDWVELFLKNLSIWPLLAVIAAIWLSRQKDLVSRITKLKFFDVELEIKLKELTQAVAENKLEIKSLENDIEMERKAFEEIIDNFSQHSPKQILSETRDIIAARARSLENISIVREMIAPTAAPEQLFAAATILRERRPTKFFPDLVDCLERLAADRNLKGVRLNTVWALTSALHRMLIAALRDHALPEISANEMKRAKEMLEKLEKNPRVQADRPDDPDRGIRGPIRLALNWIERGLSTNSSVDAIGKPGKAG